MSYLLEIFDPKWLPLKFGGKAANDNLWPYKNQEQKSKGGLM